MDYKNFGPDGPVRSKLDEQSDRRWWTMAPDDAATAITATLETLKRAQQTRVAQYIQSARLYGNAPLIGMLAGIQATQRTAANNIVKDRLTYNLVASAIDTSCALRAKNKPKPYYLTSGGNFKQRRKAKKLNTLIEGVFYECKFYELLLQWDTDSSVFGDALCHVFARHKRVVMERVLPSELYVDEIESLNGRPRQMHRVRQVDRAQLLEMFPKKASVINGEDDAPEQGSTPSVSDLVTVRESWHLRSGPDAEDGAHVITVDGHALMNVERWDKDHFPFAKYPYMPRLVGWWAQGAAERLQPMQLDINKNLATIQRSTHLMGTFKIWVKNGSKIVKEHLNNDIGTVVNSDEPPQYLLPPIVQPEVYQQVQTTIERGYEQEGISRMSATSEKPAGLDSGRAIREFSYIGNDRMLAIGNRRQTFVLDAGRLAIDTIRDIAKENGGSYPVKSPGKRSIATVDWKDIDLPEDDYVMQCFPISSLPSDPEGRLQTIQEYAQAGYLTPRQAKSLLDFPDIEAEEGLSNASEEYVSKIIDGIVDDGEYTPPDSFDDLALAREMALEMYQLGKTQDLEPERLQMLRMFIAQVDSLQQKAAPPPPSGAPMGAGVAPPQAAPMPPPVSDLLPNAPAPGGMQ